LVCVCVCMRMRMHIGECEREWGKRKKKKKSEGKRWPKSDACAHHFFFPEGQMILFWAAKEKLGILTEVERGRPDFFLLLLLLFELSILIHSFVAFTFSFLTQLI
jgi:hypothetical protein